ncbi:hypothetical protein Q5530_34550 [Saccharothrix sp. BKS2]|uniref:hypothetical protein n=1 Tax=Saccharothrix sp. BKS2 TaxID=3064400 RepID=UPI0039E84116
MDDREERRRVGTRMRDRVVDRGCRLRQAPPHEEEDGLISLTGDTPVNAVDDVRRKAPPARRAREPSRLSGPAEPAATASAAPDPGDVVTARLGIARGLAAIGDRRTRAAPVVHALGCGVAGTAEPLNTTHGAVKGALQRHRHNAGRANREGGDHA